VIVKYVYASGCFVFVGHYYSMCVEELRKNVKKESVKIAGLQAEIQTGEPWGPKQVLVF
jgi:hypothetical protein